ncbi:MAG: hypothetical protein L6Q76_06385, partial [Polyangiaceae bacterium]|nr:hypothetical protein [Polyangiaceae bacterium]
MTDKFNKVLGVLPFKVTAIVMLVAIGAPIIYIYYYTQFVWESRISALQPGIRLRLYHDISTLSMVYTGGPKGLNFSVASSFVAVKRWMTQSSRPPGSVSHDSATSDPKPPSAPIVNCNGKDKLDIPLGKDSQFIVDCTFNPDTHTITLKTELIAPKGQGADFEFNYNDVWLAPFTETSLIAGSKAVLRQPPEAMHWAKLRLDDKNAEVLAKNCLQSSRDPAASNCHISDAVFGSPKIVLSNDPHKFISEFARSFATRVVPVVVLLMMVINSLLFLYVLWLLTYLASKNGYKLKFGKKNDGAGQEGGVPLLFHVDNIHLGRRRLFEFFEVAGPAFGFLMTVGALLIAFESNVLVNGDTVGFSNALAIAMAATFAGLLMRILAFSADRLLDYNLRTSPDVTALGIVKETASS